MAFYMDRGASFGRISSLGRVMPEGGIFTTAGGITANNLASYLKHQRLTDDSPAAPSTTGSITLLEEFPPK